MQVTLNYNGEKIPSHMETGSAEELWSMPTCLRPRTAGISLKLGLSSHFPSYLFLFMKSAEIFPIFIAIFFLLVLVLFKYNRKDAKHLIPYAAFAKCTSIKNMLWKGG